MSETKDGGLAFPGVRYEQTRLQAGKPVFGDVSYPGMTLRDWFAGQALAGFFANAHTPHMNAADNDAAEYCYRMADAMLAARTGGAE